MEYIVNEMKRGMLNLDGFGFLNYYRNKSFLEMKRTSREKSKRTIKKYIFVFLDNFINPFLSRYGLKIKDITIDSNFNREVADIKILSPECQNTEHYQNILIYRKKEENNMSNLAYNSFRKCGLKMPCLNFTRRCQIILNDEFFVKKNDYGSYYEPEIKIRYYLKIFKDKMNIKNKTINIRLAGDGTTIGANLYLLNFSFGFLDSVTGKNTNPNSASGNFSLGKFFIDSENYENLDKALSELSLSLSNFNSIEIDGETYKIEYFLGGDMKFLLLVLGINGAQSNYPCPWCNTHEADFCKVRELKGQLGNTKGKTGNIMFSFIKPENIIVDMLHLFLRISDRLILLLQKDFEQLDEEYSTDLMKNPFFKKYVDFLTSLNIKKTYYKKNTEFVLRNLNGAEKRKLHNKINLANNIFGNPPTQGVSIKDTMWSKFSKIIDLCKNNRESLENIHMEIETWVNCFYKVAHDSYSTPYIHVLTSHLYQQVIYLNRLGLNINDFSMQGIEYMNNLDTKYFHRSCNKKGDIACCILKKRSRIELLMHHNNHLGLITENRIKAISLKRRRTDVFNENDPDTLLHGKFSFKL